MRNLENFKIGILIIFMAMGFSGLASKGGERATKPILTAKSMKVSLVKDLENLKMDDFNLYDATVSIEFVINKFGNVALISVEGENCLVNTYVRQMLKDKKIFVSEELRDKVHQVTVRYVRI